MGFKVIVGGKHTGGHQLLGEDLDEVQKVLRVAVADVVYGVGRNGQAVLSVFLFRGALHHPQDALHNVIYIGEVPLAVAVVEDLDGLALAQLVGKAEIGHVRPAGGTVDGEEPQTGGGDIVELGVGVGHELVALFGGGIEGDRVIHLVLGGVGDLFVGAVDAGGGGIDQVRHGAVAAGLQDVVEADEVALDVGIRIGDGVPDSGLGGQVHHHIGLPLGKDTVHSRPVGNIALHKGPGGAGMLCGAGLNLGQTPVLDGYIVVVVQVVHAHDGHRGHGIQELQHQVGANEARGTGDEDGFVFQIDLFHSIHLSPA